MTTSKIAFRAALLVLSLTLAGPALAQKWVYLGEANIDGKSDHDRIKVGDKQGLFVAIRFRVEGGPVDFDRVVAHYGNGDEETLPLRQAVRAGRFTRRLDLRGGQRKLDSVEVWYQRARPDLKVKPKIRMVGIRR